MAKGVEMWWSTRGEAEAWCSGRGAGCGGLTHQHGRCLTLTLTLTPPAWEAPSSLDLTLHLHHATRITLDPPNPEPQAGAVWLPAPRSLPSHRHAKREVGGPSGSNEYPRSGQGRREGPDVLPQGSNLLGGPGGFRGSACASGVWVACGPKGHSPGGAARRNPREGPVRDARGRQAAMH